MFAFLNNSVADEHEVRLLVERWLASLSMQIHCFVACLLSSGALSQIPTIFTIYEKVFPNISSVNLVKDDLVAVSVRLVRSTHTHWPECVSFKKLCRIIIFSFENVRFFERVNRNYDLIDRSRATNLFNIAEQSKYHDNQSKLWRLAWHCFYVQKKVSIKNKKMSYANLACSLLSIFSILQGKLTYQNHFIPPFWMFPFQLNFSVMLNWIEITFISYLN